ncbi:MAG: hypothetical protein RR758_12090, partial [Burkholderiaceae bacterium]
MAVICSRSEKTIVMCAQYEVPDIPHIDCIMPRPLLPHAVLAPAFAAVLGLASLPCAAAGTLVAAVPADPQHFNGAITTA